MKGYHQIALIVCLAFCAYVSCAVDKTKKKEEKPPTVYTVTDEAWFEVEVKDLEGKGKHYKGRFTVALFGEIVPMTVLNFASLARGYKRGRYTISYKKTPVHRVVKDFVIQMGDTVNGDGSGGRSIYGDTFVDENFIISHKATGMVAMANYGKDTNGSQFYILLTKARWLDGKHVVFGKVVRGFDVVKILGEVRTHSRTAIPVHKINITDCGLNYLDRKYTLTEAQIESEDDI